MSDGVVTNTRQRLPAAPGTLVSTGVITGTGDAGLDESEAAYVLLKDAARPGARVPLARGSKTFSRVSVSSTATQVLAANAGRGAALLTNNDPLATLYLGKDNTVTAAGASLPLAAGQTMVDDVSNDAWWAITSTGTIDVRVLEVA